MEEEFLRLVSSVTNNLSVDVTETGKRPIVKLELTEFLYRTKSTIKYIKSGTTGHTLKGSTREKFTYALKIVPYRRKNSYGTISDIKRPENAEILILNKLSNTPTIDNRHLIRPYAAFYSSALPFTNLNVASDKIQSFKDMFSKGSYHSKMSVLVSEWSSRGDLLDYARTTDVSAREWKVLFFQIIYTLASIHKTFPSFRHNDLKPNNVLLSPSRGQKTDLYTHGEIQFTVPDIGLYAKIWDFDFSVIHPIIDNKKLSSRWSRDINVSKNSNQYYDIFFFFNTLLKIKKKKGESGDCVVSDDETLRFIDDVAPPEFRDNQAHSTKSGRLLTNVQITTPSKLLETHPYFDEFRKSMSGSGS